MKIALAIDDSLDKPDGVQQYVLTLGHWLSQRGHKVHYLAGQTKRRDIANIHSLTRNIAVKYNQNRLSTPLPLAPKTAKKLMMDEQFDILHVQMPYSPFLAARLILSAPAKTAIVGTFHILPFAKSQYLANRMLAVPLRQSLKRFNIVAAVSEPAKNFAKKVYGIESIVIPNVVDIKSLVTIKNPESAKNKNLTIVFLGRLVERKGCQYLIEAFAALPAALRDQTELIVAGKGPLLQKLKDLAVQLKLNTRVMFIGFVDEKDKSKLLESADIAVFPSSGGESFGIVLIEAMAAGSKVVLGGDNPGYASVLRKEQIVNVKSKTDFADLLQIYLTDKKAIAEATEWQRHNFRQYDVNILGIKIEQMYNDAIAGRLSVN